ncbi:MAG: HAMP domain-containing sensor histidine kinase [Acidimicrobiales bacterium]
MIARRTSWGKSGWPRTIRFRLTVRYALLFFVAGAALLGLAYGLVDHSLSATPTPHISPNQIAKATKQCETNIPIKLGKKSSANIAKCINTYTAGLRAGKLSQRENTLNNLLLYSLLGLGGTTIASGGIGWMMAGRVLRPVRTITGTARRASQGNLSERVALEGPDDELKELAETFDSMLGRLDAAFSSQRDFIANASHELRTPLTAMRTAIDVTLAKPDRTPQQLEAMAERVRNSVAQSERLVEALLTLASSERSSRVVEFVDLATACEDALEFNDDRIKERDLQVTKVLEPAEMTGERLLLERMVTNLVDNATRHCDQGGSVQISCGQRDGIVYVKTSNSGESIPEDLVPMLTEPFRRAVARVGQTDGAGLGLAIVRSVAVLHGGTVTLQGLPSGGLEALVELPAQPSHVASN